MYVCMYALCICLFVCLLVYLCAHLFVYIHEAGIPMYDTPYTSLHLKHTGFPSPKSVLVKARGIEGSECPKRGSVNPKL